MRNEQEVQAKTGGQVVPQQLLGVLLLGAVFILLMGGLELAGVIPTW